MRTLFALGSGLRQASAAPLPLLLMLLVNLGLSLMVVLPLQQALDEDSRHALNVGGMAEGFDVHWWLDFGFSRAALFEALPASLALATGIHLLLSTLFSAGMLGLFTARRTGTTVTGFLEGIARLWGPYLRLLALGLPLVWLTDRLINVHAARGLESWTAAWPAERTVVGLELCREILFLAVFGLWLLVLDYARVSLAVSGGRSAWRGLLASLSFLRRHLAGAALILGAVTVAQGVALGSLGWLLRAFEGRSVGTLILSFLLGEALIWLRFGIRAAGLGAAVDYFRTASAHRTW